MAHRGWFSATAAQITGSVIWSTPSGGEVEVNLLDVNTEPWPPLFNRVDDLFSVGEVVEFKRLGKAPAPLGTWRPILAKMGI